MRRLIDLLVYVALLVGGTYGAFRPTFDSGFARLQCDPGDTVLNHYLLEHSWQAVSNPQYCGTLLSPPFFFPQRLVLGYSENFLGVAPAYWALRLVLPYDLAYQWWVIGMNALNFVAFAAVARWLGCQHVVAAVGGFLWAFGLVHVDQLTHQQMIPRFWFPLALYHARGFAERPDARSLNRLCGAVALQATACVYTGWFLVLGLSMFVPLAAMLRPGGVADVRTFLRAERGRVALILGAWGGALAVFFVPYVLANRGGGRAYSECVYYMPTLSSWVCGPDDSRWFQTIGPLRESVARDSALFCGLGLIGLTAVAAWRLWASRPRPGRPAPAGWAFPAACLIAAAALVLVTFDWHGGVSGWWLVRLLPGGGAIRVVSRVYVIVYLFVDVAVVLLLADLVRRSRTMWATAAVYGLMGFVVWEQTGHETEAFPKAEFYPHADRVADALRGAEAGHVTGEFGTWGFQANLFGMWAGLRANVPVVDGYSGRIPDGYPGWGETVLTEAEAKAWLTGRFRGTLRVVDPRDPGRPRDVTIP